MPEKHRIIPSNNIGEVGKDSGRTAKPVLNDEHILQVEVTNAFDNWTEKTVENSVNGVAKDTEQTLVSFIVPPSTNITLCGGSATGMTDAIFKLYVNGIRKETLHNAWTERNVNFKTIQEVKNEPGNIEIKITVEHWNILQAHDFYGSIFLKQKTT